MKLTEEQVREILNRYFPGEQWEDADEDLVRLCLVERATPEGETCLDNSDQFIRYSGIYGV